MFLMKRLGLGVIHGQIKKLIKENRLSFLSTDKVSFTDNKGTVKYLTFDGMTKAIEETFAESAKTAKVSVTLEQAGITHDDIKQLITDEYHKSRAYSGGLKK
jgi:hypothetical protein